MRNKKEQIPVQRLYMDRNAVCHGNCRTAMDRASGLYRSFSWRLDRRTGMDQYADQPVEYCECGRSGIIFCAGVHA